MSKNKKSKPFLPITLPKDDTNRFYEINKKAMDDNISPSIAFTYLDVEDKEYGLHGLAINHKKQRGNRNLYKELNSFVKMAGKYKNISELITNHISHIKPKSDDKLTISKSKEIRKNYNVESCNIMHIHCKRDGKGEFVLHGFALHNCFEVVFIDPLHKLHKVN